MGPTRLHSPLQQLLFLPPCSPVSGPLPPLGTPFPPFHIIKVHLLSLENELPRKKGRLCRGRRGKSPWEWKGLRLLGEAAGPSLPQTAAGSCTCLHTCEATPGPLRPPGFPGSGLPLRETSLPAPPSQSCALSKLQQPLSFPSHPLSLSISATPGSRPHPVLHSPLPHVESMGPTGHALWEPTPSSQTMFQPSASQNSLPKWFPAHFQGLCQVGPCVRQTCPKSGRWPRNSSLGVQMEVGFGAGASTRMGTTFFTVQCLYSYPRPYRANLPKVPGSGQLPPQGCSQVLPLSPSM